MAHSAQIISTAKDLYLKIKSNGQQEHSLQSIVDYINSNPDVKRTKKNKKSLPIAKTTVYDWAEKYGWSTELKILQAEYNQKIKWEEEAKQADLEKQGAEDRENALGPAYLTHELSKRKNDDLYSQAYDILLERLKTKPDDISDKDLIRLFHTVATIKKDYDKMVADATSNDRLKIKVNLNVIEKNNEKIIDASS